AFEQLAICDINQLSFAQRATDPLYEYEGNSVWRQIYDEILKDSPSEARRKSQGGCVYTFWKIKAKGRSVSIHPERYPLNLEKYREELFACVKPILQAYGVNEKHLLQLESELVQQKSKPDQCKQSILDVFMNDQGDGTKLFRMKWL